MPYQTEFPDFPASDMPAIPAGFCDTTWRNDTCPSFTSDALGLTIWVDFANPAEREFPDWPRFRVSPQNHGVEISGDCLESDNWADIEAFISARVNPMQQPKTQIHIEAEKQGLPLRTVSQVRAALEKAKARKSDDSLARLLLRHGRLTDEAILWIGDNYPSVWE